MSACFTLATGDLDLRLARLKRPVATEKTSALPVACGSICAQPERQWMHAYNWHGVISAFQRSTLAFKAARAFDATCPLSLSTPPRRCIALLSPPPTCSARRRHARAAGTTCPRPVVVASDLLGSAAASPACSTSTAYRRAAALRCRRRLRLARLGDGTPMMPVPTHASRRLRLHPRAAETAMEVCERAP